MNFLKKLFGTKEAKKEFTDEDFQNHYEEKSVGLEKVLGKSHDIVGHAIIPFEIGGAVDMYYYPNGIQGTGFATMELIKPDGNGPKPNRLGTYELVGFTKHNYNSDETETTDFNKIERRLCGIFTGIGNYSFMAKLEPGETCEFPGEENEPNKCILFDNYEPEGKQFYIGNKKHGLLLTMEILKDEMEFARQNGSGKLIEKLKEKGVFPYSDLDRNSVLN
ncbi:hypothetical protein [Flavobacterium sp.]|uniref:hypothetical protein n=1 Tax=Flavobacterium sp. TaxID=239 RepID=UPI00391CFBD9